MRVGRLRHLITLQTLQSVRNEYGEVEKGYADLAKVWASIEPISANEKYLRNQENMQITHKIEIRFLKSIGVTMQILFNERKFEVKSVINPLEKNEKLILLATENEH